MASDNIDPGGKPEFVKGACGEPFPKDFRLATVAEVEELLLTKSGSSAAAAEAAAGTNSLWPGRGEAFRLKDGYLFEFGTMKSFHVWSAGGVELIYNCKLGLRRSSYPESAQIKDLDAALALLHACYYDDEDEDEVRDILRRNSTKDGVMGALRLQLPWVEGGTVFHACCWKGNLRLLRVLLQQKEEESASPLLLPDSKGRTPLWWAASCRSADLVIELLKHIKPECKLSINQRDLWEFTPLMIAASQGNANTCKELLRVESVDVTCRDAQDNSILHLCALRRSDPVETLEVLLNDKRVLIQMTMNNIAGNTPFSLALECGNSQFCEHIVGKVEARNFTTHSPYADAFSRNILHVYALGGVESVGDLLLKALGSSAKHLINTPNIEGWTPFVLATVKGNWNAWVAFWRLSDHEFLREFKDYQTGNNILHYYARAPELKGIVGEELVQSMTALVNESNDDGFTPIMYALQSGHTEAQCVFLLKAQNLQLDFDKVSASNNRNILHMYARGGVVDEAAGRELMRRLGVEKVKTLITQKDFDGRTPLMVALRHGHASQASNLLELLSAHGVTQSLKEVDEMQNNMLHLLCKADKANKELLTKLITLETDSEGTNACINAPNADERNTPVMCALVRGNTLVCRLLFEAIETANGKLSLSWEKVNAQGNNMLHCWCIGSDADADWEKVNAQGNNMLHSGCTGSDADAKFLEKLLSVGTEADITHLINTPNANGDTPLMCALKMGKTGICRLLLDGRFGRGLIHVPGNEKYATGLNVFHLFAMGSCADKEVWEQLKEAHDPGQLSAVLNAQDSSGVTPLMYALASKPHSDECSLLFLKEDCVIVNGLADHNGKTVLHYLNLGPSVFNIKVLVELRRREWPKELIHSADKHRKMSPFMAAAGTGSMALLEMLLQEVAGTDFLNEVDSEKKNILHIVAKSTTGNLSSLFQLVTLYLQAGEDKLSTLVDKVDNFGATPLQLAALFGNVIACAWLLEKLGDKAGAAVEEDTEQISNPTALHCAARNQVRPEQRIYVLKVLLSKVTDRKQALKVRSKWNTTVLTEAWRNHVSNLPLLQLLLQECPELEQEEEKIDYSLHVKATLAQDVFAMQFLFNRNPLKLLAADIISKQTLLHTAVLTGSALSVLKVLQYRTDLVQKQFVDAEGKTALHLACKCENIAAVRVLLKVSKELSNIATSGGKTPLHEAAGAANDAIVKELLKIQDIGSLLSQRDADGRTALHFAAARTMWNEDDVLQVVKVLLDYEEEKGPYKPLLLYASAGHVVGTAYDLAKLHHPQVAEYLSQQMAEAKSSGTRDLLQLAQEQQNISMVKELINRGASLHKVEQGYLQVLHIDKTKQADQPTMKDFLGRKNFAKGIAALLLNPFTAIPITIGLFGPWGMGKSSLMLQIEISLLQTIVQRNLLPSTHIQEEFPGFEKDNLSKKGTRLQDQFFRIIRSSKAATRQNTTRFYDKIWKRFMLQITEVFSRFCCRREQSNLSQDTTKIQQELLQDFFSNYDDEWRPLYKGLALADRRELVQIEHDKLDQKKEIIGELPSLLTIRYNAWLYEGELEASAGLALTIMREMESCMSTAQWLKHCWRYSYRKKPDSIIVNIIIPMIIIVVVGGWILWLVWRLLSIPNNEALSGFKYGSIPVSMLVITWSVLRNIMSAVKPASEQLLECTSTQKDQEQKLGYQQEVIDDIIFFKNHLCEKPGLGWMILGKIWSIIVENRDHIPGTNITKMSISERNFRVIAFVDDLDRCKSHKYILQLLGAMNLILSVCKINVVVGMDKTMVENAINKEYNDTDMNAEKFLQKIIQVPVDLYEPSQEEMTSFLRKQLGFLEKKQLSSNQIHHRENASQERESTSSSSRNVLLGDETKRHDVIVPVLGTTSSNDAPTTIQDGLCIEFPVLVANYNDSEVEAFEKLHPKAKDDCKHPRNWKRLLNYHRLVWNIISQSTSELVKNLEGWQQQLIVWVFVCYNWKPQMDVIIENWEHMFVNFEEPAVSQQASQGKIKKSAKKDEDDEQTATHHDEDEQKATHHDKDRIALLKSTSLKYSPSLSAIINVWFLQNKDKFSSAVEREQWEHLRDTLDGSYDVSMAGIQAFQNYRFHCKTGHLRWKPGMMELKV